MEKSDTARVASGGSKGSHRDQLRSLIAEYGSRHASEGELIERFGRFVDDHPRCMDRELSVGHVTASAWVVDPLGGEVLLTHHRKLDIWVQLGGHLDGDEGVVQGALREAREESGLDSVELVEPGRSSRSTEPAASPWIFDLDIHTIPERRRSDGAVEAAHEHFDVRFAVRAAQRSFSVSDESHDLAWVPVAELERWTQEESMLRMARKWLRATSAG